MIQLILITRIVISAVISFVLVRIAIKKTNFTLNRQLSNQTNLTSESSGPVNNTQGVTVINGGPVSNHGDNFLGLVDVSEQISCSNTFFFNKNLNFIRSS